MAALVTTTRQVPAEVAVSESPFVTEQPAEPLLLTAKETVPVSLPPELNSRRFVRYVPLVELRLSAACVALAIVNVEVS